MLSMLNENIIRSIIHYGRLFQEGKFLEAFYERKKITEEKDAVIIQSMKETFVESKHRQLIDVHYKKTKKLYFSHCSCGWVGEDTYSYEKAQNTYCPNKLNLMLKLKVKL